jgi:PPOX class probable F420-dependent enzyme
MTPVVDPGAIPWPGRIRVAWSMKGNPVADLSAFAELVPLDNGLCVLSTLRRDGSVHATVVNAGVLGHPVTGERVVGLVAGGGTRKLAHLRADPRATVVARAGWRWAAVEGPAGIIGPDDPHPGVDGEALRLLLRDVFRAAGGTHEDWDVYDRVMAEERRAAVLVVPARTYGIPSTG